MGFVGCLEKPPNTPSSLRTPRKDVLCLAIDESITSPKQGVADRMRSLNNLSLCRTDLSDKLQTPQGLNHAFVKQSSWGYIDLFLDSEKNEDESETNGEITSPNARKTIRLDSKRKSAKEPKSEKSGPKNKHHEQPVAADNDQALARSMEISCRKHQSPVRRLVRTLSLTSTRSILTSPRHRTPLGSQLSRSKLEDEAKNQGKGCSQSGLRRSGSFRLCATETGAVDTSTPGAALRHLSVSPRRRRHVKKQTSDSGLVSPKLEQAISLSSISSPVKSRSQTHKMTELIVSGPNSTPSEAEELKIDVKQAILDPKTWDDLIIEFDNIADD
jgi:hypothetical protein